MSLVFERIQTPGIAELSYLVGDDKAGVAALVDPRADVEVYVELARRSKVAITHVFETHIHADLISGARELCARVGGSAKLCASVEGGARYGFDHEPVRDGDRFELGSVVLTARHTPGHTPEHVCYLLAERSLEDAPWGVLTGDALFVNSAGRPDLLGAEQSEKLARQQFRTLTGFFLRLDDHVIIHPAHGAGSPCGADIGDRMESTIGYERRFNPFLQFKDEAAFIDYALSTAPPEPIYYKRMKQVNARGPEVLGGLPAVPGLPPAAFREAAERGQAVVVDTRNMLAFGGGHIPGALNIGAEPTLSIWAGWMLDPEHPSLLVLEKDDQLAEVLRLFVRTGYTRFAGYLVGGMKAWDTAGLPLAEIGQMTADEIEAAADRLQLLDVRSPQEWKEGHIPGARHLFVPEVREKAVHLDKTQPTATYCDSGYRASLAASILQQEGFTDVRNVPGSWQAWKSAGFPVEGKEEPS